MLALSDARKFAKVELWKTDELKKEFEKLGPEPLGKDFTFEKFKNVLAEKKGKVKPVSGGRTIVQELEYAENGTYKRYSGYDILNITPSDVFTAAQFAIAQAAARLGIKM